MSPSRRDSYGPPGPPRPGATGRAGVPRPGGPRPPRPARTAPLDPPPHRERMPRPDAFPEIEPLPPARPRGHYRGKRRQENPWASYGLIVAVPLVLVLLIVGFSALPPYTPNSRAQSQPNGAGTTAAGTGPASPAQADPPAAATPVSVYEAESAGQNTLGPTTKKRAVTAASGGEVISSIGHGTPAGDVKFNAVTATTAGKYTLTIYYLLGDTVAHRLALWVNGRGPTVLSFPPSGGVDRIKTFRATVTLTAGTNNIRFSNATQAFGPDLDRITVQPQ